MTATLLPAPLRGAYLDAMAGLAGGVTIVTALDDGGRPAGLTTTSTVSVSADPPILSTSIWSGSRSLSAILSRDRFCVNILRPCGTRAAQLFATRRDDKFEQVDWEPGPTGLPCLPLLSAHVVECRVVSSVPVGDHVLLLGEVLAVLPGRPLDAGTAEPDGRSLVYWRRQWREVC